MKTIFKITEEQKAQMLSLYEEGKMDSEIAKILGNVTPSAICYWRKKLGLKSKFTYEKISKIDAQKCKELFEQGLSDYKIANILGVSPDGIYSHRQRYGLIRNGNLAENKEIPLSQEQKEFMIGTMLGDASMAIGKYCKNPRFTCMHCAAQKEYAEYKTSLFATLGARCVFRKRHTADKRNGKYYENYTIEIPANPSLLKIYNSFYKNGVKHIPFDLLNDFTDKSLALWYMDDGYRIRNVGYVLCTNCFNIEELVKMQFVLKAKFGLETSIWKDRCLYIKKNCVKKFNALILPYICECMSYKII